MTRTHYILMLVGVLSLAGGCSHKPTFISGTLTQYQPVTLSFAGPTLLENGPVNPFTDYRMTVRFTKGKRVIEVPGYFAADGYAAESSATGGNVWRAHFLPDEPGKWKYEATLKYGLNAAVDDSTLMTKVSFSGAKGTLNIKPASGADTGFYRTGPLRYVGKRYLQFANGQYFLKNGADSPENFLAYAHFDGTAADGEKFLHRYEPHVKDWVDEQPTWKDGKGKGIIGALNYLASRGVNSLYFLTYNIDGGDGKDVFMWSSPADKLHFDCSKLDQWEIVFTHMDRLGIAMHVVTQEAENDNRLGKGQLRAERRLYYRELIARFAHHPAIVWNLGEENTNTDQQRLEFAHYIRQLDPYKHPIVVHTAPGAQDRIFTPLLGYEAFEGASLQTDMAGAAAETFKWVAKSHDAGRPWFVMYDEQTPADIGVKPDAEDPAHDAPRRALWGNLLAGGSGAEWYFGYKSPNNDLNCEDFRSRENMWKLGRLAVDFMHDYVPFAQMRPSPDSLKVASGKGYCMAGRGVYLVYLAQGQRATLHVNPGRQEIFWFNPRTGKLFEAATATSTQPATAAVTTSKPTTAAAAKTVPPLAGEKALVESTSELDLGTPPVNDGQDWVVLVRVWP